VQTLPDRTRKASLQFAIKPVFKLAYGLLRISWFFTRPVTLGVRILLIREQRVLLVRHTYQDAWFIPGGMVKRGETLEQAIRREVQEECGAQLQNLQLFGAYTNFMDYKSDHVVVFLSTAFEVVGTKDWEIERVAFFPLDHLPEDISPGCLHRIEEYSQGRPPGYGKW
jgi:8-oxo-dGTP pyrophosphatase MutT (NUDIX family)